ncbi:MAG: aspartate aminotransferase [Gemmatimonadetes bacterium]|nr:aspartate aminotransferase [Gemmatimonadota bacterium]
MTDIHRLNPVVDRIEPSATIAITNRARELKRAGVDVISLSAGEPDFDTPAHIIEAAFAGVKAGMTRYTPADGSLELKEAIAAKLKRENGVDYALEEIAASCGGKHTLHNIFAVILAPGDEVIIPAPYWVSYPEQVRLAGGVPRVIEAGAGDGFRITAEMFEEAIGERTRALVLNSPSNPTGAVYGRAEIEALVEVAVRRGVLVVSDEVYEHILYDGAAQISPASLSAEAREHVIVANSVSKTYAMTGWRVGYAAGPAKIMRAMARLQSHQSQNPASPSQAAATAALGGGLDCVRPMLAAFTERRAMTIGAIESMPGLSLAVPRGAFYAFPDATEVLRPAGSRFEGSVGLCAHLLDEYKVACVPGEAFGAPTCFRISFATATDALREALDRIARAIGALRR